MAAPFKLNNPFDHPFFDSSYLFAAVRARRISEKLNPGFNFLKNPITTTPSEKASGDLIRKMLLFRKEDPYEHPSFTDPAITHKELHYEGNQSFSFQSDAPGGPEGICHTSSMARGASTCDGVGLLETREEGDKTMSQPLQNLCDLYPSLREVAVILQENLENNPFDDPFFTVRPFFLNPASRLYHQFDGKSSSERQLKEIAVEELHSDDNSQKLSFSVDKPIITSPSENDCGNQTFSLPSVAPGGPEGMYHTSSTARGSTGGVVLLEMKEEHKTMGEALHTTAKGIKGKRVAAEDGVATRFGMIGSLPSAKHEGMKPDAGAKTLSSGPRIKKTRY